MFPSRVSVRYALRSCSPLLALLVVIALSLTFVLAQSQTQQPSQQPATPPSDASPEAGGPGGDNGVIALPKKKDNPDNAPLPPAPAQPKL